MVAEGRASYSSSGIGSSDWLGCLVYVNTLMLQRVLAEPAWLARMTPADRRGLTPLVWGHVSPYGTFDLDMEQRLDLDLLAAA